MGPCFALRRGRDDLRGDLREEGVHVGAGRGDAGDGDERDQRDEQCVLEEVLSVFEVRELLEASDEYHVRFSSA